MMRLIECVPNFSEGRSARVIRSIADAISRIKGVRLLHVHSNADANRTVMTFVGKPKQVADAACLGIARAAELIDMRHHRGAHPRLGAADVCPFVPLVDVTVEECARLARNVGERIGRELAIPVYLYGTAAETGDRGLSEIRRGEYEGLSKKLAAPGGSPDFGPLAFNEKTGATIIGARNILIAFNVNLNTTDQTRAREIAKTIRGNGRTGQDGESQAGNLKACKALGWFMPAYGCAQVSMNLEDYRVTPLHAAFEEVVSHARQWDLEVTGSELVGMVPLEAMLMTGRYYVEQEDLSVSSVDGLVDIAVEALGLSSVGAFQPDERIIEYRLRKEGGRWTELAARLAAASEVSAMTMGVANSVS